MKNSIFIILFLFINYLNCQEKLLISENNDIKLFETHISLHSEGNIFPSMYKEGLIYASNHNLETYRLLYTSHQSKSIKLKTGNKYSLGALAIFNDEVYFTGISKIINSYGDFNFAIYKGVLNDFKLKSVEALKFCNKEYSYTYPTISKDGSTMVVVSNEQNSLHLLELKRNENNEWEKSDVLFICQPTHEIINPVIFNENTIYFSSKSNEEKTYRVQYTNKKGETLLSNVIRESGVFNIYKLVKENGIWKIPKLMDALNSDFDDLGVLFIDDKKGYLTTSRYNDSENIFYFELKQ